jgi:hypothetical protein
VHPLEHRRSAHEAHAEQVRTGGRRKTNLLAIVGFVSIVTSTRATVLIWRQRTANLEFGHQYTVEPDL